MTTLYRLMQLIRNAQDPEYANWVDAIGDGLQDDAHIKEMLPVVHDDETLINFMFPHEILQDPAACVSRSIFAPTNRQIEQYNNRILAQIDEEEKLYIAADTVKEAEVSGCMFPDSALDYLARKTPAGIAEHKIEIIITPLSLRSLALHSNLKLSAPKLLN